MKKLKTSVFWLSLLALAFVGRDGLARDIVRVQPDMQAGVFPAETTAGPPESLSGGEFLSSGESGATGSIEDRETGKISLDLKGIDIVELLKILAMKMDINIVPTKEVQGRVNVYLNDVTFQDAMDIVMLTNGLASVRDGNIVTVMPVIEKYNQTYGKRYDDLRRIRTYKLKYAAPKDIMGVLSQLKSDVGKLIIDEATGTVLLIDTPDALDLMERTLRTLDISTQTEIFQLKYAKAEDVKGQLGAIFTPGSSQVELDARTNKIAITDLPEKMKKIRKMIAEFDVPTKQVLIEAQIVQVALNDATQFGIDWDRIFHSKVDPIRIVGKFPVSGVNNALTIGSLAKNDFQIVIQALQAITKTKILSRPRIAVVNNQEASILIGTKEVYFSQTQSQSSVTTTTAEQVNYVDVGVKLNVTPMISDDGFVTMKIRPEVSSVREFATSSLGSKVPVVETSQAETMVKVKDNAMIMIAGLMKDEDRYTRNQLPFFGNLPFISWFFGNRTDTKVKTELAIFLTPTIITGDVAVPDAREEEVRTRGVVTKRFKERMD